MNIQDLIKPELLILIPVLYFIGIAIKKSELPNKYIPLTLGIISISLCMLWVIAMEGLSAMSVFVAVTQGVLVASTGVYADQLYKQLNKEE